MMMTENQAEQLFTVTIESRRPDTHHWDITAQATDTLAGLVEWAAPANPVCEPPRLPLTAEAVRGFIGATFEREDVRNRVRLEPAAPGEPQPPSPEPHHHRDERPAPGSRDTSAPDGHLREPSTSA